MGWEKKTLSYYKYFLSDFNFSKKLPLNLASGMLCNRTHSIRNYDPLEQLRWTQPHSNPGRMPEADICFTFLGSGQSLPGVAEWHSVLSICRHCSRSSLGQLANLCTRVTCRVWAADQHGFTMLPRPGPAHRVLLPGRRQAPSQELMCCHCCLVEAIWNTWRLRSQIS